jgi:hypothetical protein
MRGAGPAKYSVLRSCHGSESSQESSPAIPYRRSWYKDAQVLPHLAIFIRRPMGDASIKTE